MAIIQRFDSASPTPTDTTFEAATSQVVDAVNNNMTGNYVGLAITVVVALLLLGIIATALRRRKMKRQQANLLENTGNTFSADEISEMTHSGKKSGRSDFSAARILGV